MAGWSKEARARAVLARKIKTKFGQAAYERFKKSGTIPAGLNSDPNAKILKASPLGGKGKAPKQVPGQTQMDLDKAAGASGGTSDEDVARQKRSTQRKQDAADLKSGSLNKNETVPLSAEDEMNSISSAKTKAEMQRLLEAALPSSASTLPDRMREHLFAAAFADWSENGVPDAWDEMKAAWPKGEDGINGVLSRLADDSAEGGPADAAIKAIDIMENRDPVTGKRREPRVKAVKPATNPTPPQTPGASASLLTPSRNDIAAFMGEGWMKRWYDTASPLEVSNGGSWQQNEFVNSQRAIDAEFQKQESNPSAARRSFGAMNPNKLFLVHQVAMARGDKAYAKKAKDEWEKNRKNSEANGFIDWGNKKAVAAYFAQADERNLTSAFMSYSWSTLADMEHNPARQIYDELTARIGPEKTEVAVGSFPVPKPKIPSSATPGFRSESAESFDLALESWDQAIADGTPFSVPKEAAILAMQALDTEQADDGNIEEWSQDEIQNVLSSPQEFRDQMERLIEKYGAEGGVSDAGESADLALKALGSGPSLSEMDDSEFSTSIVAGTHSFADMIDAGGYHINSLLEDPATTWKLLDEFVRADHEGHNELVADDMIDGIVADNVVNLAEILRDDYKTGLDAPVAELRDQILLTMGFKPRDQKIADLRKAYPEAAAIYDKYAKKN